jgi:hypothetical protein
MEVRAWVGFTLLCGAWVCLCLPVVPGAVSAKERQIGEVLVDKEKLKKSE